MPGEVADIKKPDPCTEGIDVYAAGIRVKAGAYYRGDPTICLVLQALRGIGKGRRKSAESVVGPRSTDHGSKART